MDNWAFNINKVAVNAVVFLGSLSDSKSVAFDISQGTILGPLLIILFINDLPNCLSNSQPDTHLAFANKDPDVVEQNLNHD